MTIINPNSISGITSITAQGSNIDFFKSDGALAGLELGGVNFYSTSGVSTFSSIHVGNDIRISSGIVTATTFSGALSGNVTGNVSSSGVSTVTTLHATNIKHPSFGSDTFVLDSSGNINIDSGGVYYDATNNRLAIGTTSPDTIFSVATARSDTAGSGWFTYTHSATSGKRGLRVDTNNGFCFDYYNGSTWSQQAAIDSSGRLLVGTVSSVNSECIFQTAGNSTRDWAIKYTGTAGGAETGIRWLDKNNAVNAQISNNLVDDGVGTAAAHLVFKTATGGTLTERMRITNAGYLALGGKITDPSGGDGVFFHGGDGTNYLKGDVNSDFIFYIRNDSANPRGIRIQSYGISSGSNGNYPIFYDDLSSSRFYFFTNGGLANVQANDLNLCDEREKKNIEPLGSTWDCLKSWELKKFHYNEDSDVEDKRYGVIAQQIAAHCPEVINDWVKQVAEDPVLDDEGNVLTPGKEKIVRMGVKEQQLYWMAIKALQEAQVRIEALETEVAALKAQ